MNKKIEQITINGCCETTSIWLENESKGQLHPRWVVSGKRDKDAFSIIGYYIFRTKKKLINFISHQNGLYYKIILFAFKLPLPALFKWPKEQGGAYLIMNKMLKIMVATVIFCLACLLSLATFLCAAATSRNFELSASMYVWYISSIYSGKGAKSNKQNILNSKRFGFGKWPKYSVNMNVKLHSTMANDGSEN